MRGAWGAPRQASQFSLHEKRALGRFNRREGPLAVVLEGQIRSRIDLAKARASKRALRRNARRFGERKLVSTLFGIRQNARNELTRRAPTSHLRHDANHEDVCMRSWLDPTRSAIRGLELTEQFCNRLEAPTDRLHSARRRDAEIVNQGNADGCIPSPLVCDERELLADRLGAENRNDLLDLGGTLPHCNGQWFVATEHIAQQRRRGRNFVCLHEATVDLSDS